MDAGPVSSPPSRVFHPIGDAKKKKRGGGMEGFDSASDRKVRKWEESTCSVRLAAPWGVTVNGISKQLSDANENNSCLSH
jgi:hypothetical protein